MYIGLTVPSNRKRISALSVMIAKKSLKILLVDDSKIMRRVISSLLRKMGYAEVLEAPNALKALKILDSENIDFVISDYSMPGQSGLELLKAMRRDPRKKDIPFVMVTAEAQLAQIIAAFSAGAQHYVTKPFTLKYLAYIINKVVLV
jgi:two-component system, chemotaxis family, chemotaxis protein CheY